MSERAPTRSVSGSDAEGAAQSALRLTTMACPVCSHGAAHPKLRHQAVVELKRDIDLRPQEFKWLLRDVEPVNPLMFFVWGCPACGFASANSRWAQPWKGTELSQLKFQTALKGLLYTDSKARRMIQSLHPDSSKQRTYLNAFELTIIALFLSLNVEEFVAAETMVPARYYLRLAWFLREADETDRHTVTAADLERSLVSVKEFWPEVPTSERACRERAIELYTKALTNSRSTDTARDEVELILLIGRLYMSIGELGEARAFIDRARASTRKFEQEKSTSEREGIPESTRVEMGRDLRLMERMHEDVRKLFDDIKTEVREAQRKLAEPLLAAHVGLPAADIREILQRSGVDLEFAREFAPDPKPQAKGFFGSLFR